jgi:GNAT superfamily N-acetyltransferase
MLGYRRLGFMVCRLDASALQIESRAPVEVARLTECDGEAYVKFRRGGSMTDFHDRIAKGSICYAAKHEGRLASVSWVAEGRGILRSLDGTFKLKPDQVYLFDSFTDPDFRGLRMQAAIFARVRMEALRSGRCCAVVFVAPENRANIRSRRRMAFAWAGFVVRIKIGPWCWYISRGQAPAMERFWP